MIRGGVAALNDADCLKPGGSERAIELCNVETGAGQFCDSI